MKIIHIISSLNIGGAERLISDMLPLMKIRGVEISILVYKRIYNQFEEQLSNGGIKIINLDYKSFFHPLIIFSLIKKMRGYDIAHVHLFPALYQAAIAGLFLNTKLIYTEHSSSNKRRKHPILKYLERWVYGRYKFVACVSDLTKKNVIDWVGGLNDRFIIVSNGINLKAFSVDIEEKEHPFTIIMISRFREPKDQPTVIKAMSYINQEIHLIFVGDGETRTSCEELTRQIGVKERVHFVGKQENVAHWIAKANVGVLSSKWEGLPLTIVEMMAGGLPVVASDAEGIRQVVGDAGLMFGVGDYKQLASIINKLYEDNQLYNCTAQKCHQRAALYDINQTVDQYLNLYHQV